MTTHYDIDPADKNMISPAIKSQRSTEQETVNMIWNDIVHEWRPKSETVFLRMGGWALPLLSSATAYEVARNGFQLNNAMGGKLNFRMRAFVTYASIALSGGMNIFGIRYLVLEDILLQKTACPMCVHTRSMGLQLASATLFSTAVSAFGANMAQWRKPGVSLIQGFSSTILRSRGILLLSGFVNMFCSFIVTYNQQKEWHYIQYEMAKFEEAVKEEEQKEVAIKTPEPFFDEKSPYIIDEEEAEKQSEKLWKRL